jgi:hypothetical protein
MAGRLVRRGVFYKARENPIEAGASLVSLCLGKTGELTNWRWVMRAGIDDKSGDYQFRALTNAEVSRLAREFPKSGLS